MDLFTKEQLTELARVQEGPCVSIFMPTLHVESQLAQNPIRLKNLVRRTRQEMKDMGHREPVIDKVLEPLNDLLGFNDFWLDQSDGLAVFLTPDEVRFFRLPLSFEELVFVGDRFHLKPLFPILASNNVFYLLALSQTYVRLYQGTHYSISVVQSTEIPKDIVEVLWAEDYSPDTSKLQQGDRLKLSAGNAQFHGHGLEPEDLKHEPHDELLRFFQGIDRGIHETLREERAPLLLAGVEYYLPIYRRANSYQHLIEDTIVAGSPVRIRPEDLHPKAWEIVYPRFLEAQAEAINQFKEQYSRNGHMASEELKEIVPAAVFSRVDKLFVPIGQHVWGRYDEVNNTVELHEERQPGDDDLLDLAAIHTYMHGGTVHALQPENMPASTPLAATFRYPADVTASER